jgi:hypothetical protein
MAEIACFPTGNSGPDRTVRKDAILCAATGYLVFEQVPAIDTGTDQRVPLQVGDLLIIVRRDVHVSEKHVRKTSSGFRTTYQSDRV